MKRVCLSVDLQPPQSIEHCWKELTLDQLHRIVALNNCVTRKKRKKKLFYSIFYQLKCYITTKVQSKTSSLSIVLMVSVLNSVELKCKRNLQNSDSY